MATTLASLHLQPEGMCYNHHPETLPEEREQSDESEDERKVFSRPERPMSPTTEVL